MTEIRASPLSIFARCFLQKSPSAPHTQVLTALQGVGVCGNLVTRAQTWTGRWVILQMDENTESLCFFQFHFSSFWIYNFAQICRHRQPDPVRFPPSFIFLRLQRAGEGWSRICLGIVLGGAPEKGPRFPGLMTSSCEPKQMLNQEVSFRIAYFTLKRTGNTTNFFSPKLSFFKFSGRQSCCSFLISPVLPTASPVGSFQS